MRFHAIAVVLVVSAAVASNAEQFFLKGDDGTSYGPFELADGAKVQIGSVSTTVSRSHTQDDQIRAAMEHIILPEVDFRCAGIRGAFNYLQQQSQERDPQKRGINIVLQLDETPSATDVTPEEPTVTFKARDIGLLEAVKIVTSVAGLKYQVRDGVVWITSLNIPDGPIVRKIYNVMPAAMEQVSSSSDADGGTNTQRAFDWRTLFGNVGVEWPKGSSIQYIRGMSTLVIANTRSNIERFENSLALLNVIPYQMEVQMEFVAFDMTNIAKLVSGSLSASALTRLWTNGQAQLLAAPRVLTQPGVQASVKGVTGYIYPTGWNVATNAAVATPATPSSTNQIETASPPATVQPTSFETREVGSMFTILPELSAEGQMISLTLAPELVDEPTWRRYSAAVQDSKGDLQVVEQERPLFHTYGIHTTISVSNGAKVLVGGGVPSSDGSKIVYMFVTARLIDMDGVPLKTHKPGEEF
jgi:hypothetical protein